MTVTSRERNRRGEGTRLRADIVAAAAAILDETGQEQDITLRAVARRVGISAPSIYAHFADRDEIVDAVVDDAFDEFNAAIQNAADRARTPLTRVRAGCAAYLSFAETRPARYRLLFERDHVPQPGDTFDDLPDGRLTGFNRLVDSIQDCIDAGLSRSTDAAGDATVVWLGLHGYATLRRGMPLFPWPGQARILDRLVHGVAGIQR